MATEKTLRPPEFLDTGVNKRRFGFVWKVLLPGVVIYFVIMNWLNAGKSSPAVLGASVVPTVIPTQVVALFAQPTSVFMSGGSPSDVLKVKCYATISSNSLFGSGSSVDANGLFLAQKFTRVNSGMIYSDKLGWHKVAEFACAPGLDKLEVEFAMPTATRTRVPYVAPSVTRVVPTIVPTVTPTLSDGIAFFSINGCSASWLVWNVQSVFLISGSNRLLS